MAGSPFRRRRILWSLFALTLVFVFYLGTRPEGSFKLGSWSLPAYLKDLGLSSSSRLRLVADAKADAASTRPRAREIDGLLHFVTAYPDRRLTEDDGGLFVQGLGKVTVDPAEEIDLRVFAPDGDTSWVERVREFEAAHPLIVFSKSYCPYVLLHAVLQVPHLMNLC